MYSIMSSANSDSFTSSFPIWIPFISFFFLWMQWLKLPKLCGIRVVRVGNLVLFLILEEMVSVFHHWERSWLWVFHSCPLSMEVEDVSFYSYCLEYFYHEKVLELNTFYASIQMIMCVFCSLLYSINMLYYINWILCITALLHSWISHTWSWCIIVFTYC